MNRFDISPGDIPGLLLIRPKPIADHRGWFMRSFAADEFAEAGIHLPDLAEENHSRSVRGVIRGLHVRAELREAKLVRVTRGSVYDVAVDLRPNSPTFLRWRAFVLDDVDHLQVRIPAGCAHGFQALSDTVDVVYKVDAAYDPARDVTIAWNDPDIGVTWPLEEQILSDRDRSAPKLSEVRDNFEAWYGDFHVQ